MIKGAETGKKEVEEAGIEEQIEIAVIKAEQKYKNPTLDNVIQEIKNTGVISDANQVDRETGAVTSDLGYVIEGKLDKYINKQEIVKVTEIRSETNIINLSKDYDNSTDGLTYNLASVIDVLPENATNKEVDYIITSGEENVSVSSDGIISSKVSQVGNYTSIIKVISKDDENISLEVTVNITINPMSIGM